MPVAKRRLNFSELITKAAALRNEQRVKQIKYVKAIENLAKAVTREDIRRESSIRPHSKTVSAAVVISSYIRHFYESLPIQLTRGIIIIIAFVTLSMTASENMSDKSKRNLIISDFIVDIFFIVEGFLKLSSLFSTVIIKTDIGEKLKYVDILMDSGVVEILIAVMCLMLGHSQAGLWCRLVRVLVISTVLLKHMPHIDVLMSGISLGVVSLMSTWLLLGVVFFIYAACALTLFSENDPFHFGSIAMSMWTFFEMATLDNWEKVMYINMYGCDVSPFYYKMAEELNGTAYENINGRSIEAYGEMFLPICEKSVARPLVASFVFITFILICGFILVSLTVAAVTAGINDRITQIQHEDDNESDDISLDSSLQSEVNDNEGDFVDRFDPELVLLMLKQIWKQHEAAIAKLNLRKRTTTVKVDDINAVSRRVLLQKQNSRFNIGNWFYNLMNCFDAKRQSIVMRNVTGHTVYKIIFAFTIFLAAFLEIYVLQKNKRYTSIVAAQVVLQVYFTVDIALKLLAHYPEYMTYFNSSWNIFDIVLVVVTWTPFFTVGMTGSEYLGLVRVLRILRVLRLLTWISNLNIMMQAIGGSMKALIYVVFIMCIFFYHVAIAGVYLFAENDYYHFGSLWRAFVSIFQICTLANWSDLARTNMYGCDLYGYESGKEEYDSLCEKPNALGWFAAWYFVLVIVFGVMVLVSLFVGIIITSMELLKEGIEAEANVWAKVREKQQELRMSDSAIDNMLEVFEIVDRTKNATLTLAEITPVLALAIPDEVDQIRLFMKVDDDNSGQIDFSEFLGIVVEMGEYYKRDQVAADRAVANAANQRTMEIKNRRRRSVGLVYAAHDSSSSGAAKETAMLPTGRPLRAVGSDTVESGRERADDTSLVEQGVGSVESKDESADDNATYDTYACESGVAGVDYLWLR